MAAQPLSSALYFNKGFGKTIELKFSYTLEDHEGHIANKHFGPLFTQWLPNGEKDSIMIDAIKMKGKLYFWFDRFGYVDKDGFIKFDYKRKETEEDTINRQGVLEAGPLIGKLIIDEVVSKKLIRKIKTNKINDQEYIELGKKIVKDIISGIQSLIYILKYKFGQYWLPDVEIWDSRKYPLGVFCKYHLNLKIKFKENDDWIGFIPDDEVQTLSSTVTIKKSFPEYINKTEWNDIRTDMSNIHIDISINRVLINSYTYFQKGDFSTSIIYGCTALELAIEKYYDIYKEHENIKKEISAFFNLPLKTKTIAILSSANIFDTKAIKTIIYFIDLRNKIIHDGYIPSEKLKYSFREFLISISKHILKVNIKLPDANHGNALLK